MASLVAEDLLQNHTTRLYISIHFVSGFHQSTCIGQLQALKEVMRSLAAERDEAVAAEAAPLRQKLLEQQQRIDDLQAALDTAQKVCD